MTALEHCRCDGTASAKSWIEGCSNLLSCNTFSDCFCKTYRFPVCRNFLFHTFAEERKQLKDWLNSKSVC
jgi:hypothetical protein